MTAPANLGAYREGVAQGQRDCVADLYRTIYGNDAWPDRPLDTIWNHLLEVVRTQLQPTVAAQPPGAKRPASSS